MQSRTRMKLTVKDGLVALAYLASLAFIVFRLLDRDPGAGFIPVNSELDTVRWTIIAFLIVAGLLIVLFAGLPVIYYMLRSGRWTPMHVTAGVLVTLVTGLLLYVPLSYLYEKSLGPRQPFHSHLQLFPHDIDLPDRTDNTLVIAFLGGSTTEFTNWTMEVGRILQSQFPDRRVITLNQGRQWYTVLHSLINYETNVRQVKPDYVVVMHAINDLTVNADHSYYVNGPFRRDYGHHTGPLTRLARTRPLLDLIVDVARYMFFWQRREVIDTDVFKGLPVFTGYYKRLIQLIRLDGSRPVVMAQPYLYKPQMTEEEKHHLYMPVQNSTGPDKVWSIDTARRGMEQYVRAVRELAKSEDVPLIDLEAAMPKDLKYLKDDCHYTEAGAALVAERVSASLAQLIRETP